MVFDYIVRDHCIEGPLQLLTIAVSIHEGIVPGGSFYSLSPQKINEQPGAAAVVENPIRFLETFSLDQVEPVLVTDAFAETHLLSL